MSLKKVLALAALLVSISAVPAMAGDWGFSIRVGPSYRHHPGAYYGGYVRSYPPDCGVVYAPPRRYHRYERYDVPAPRYRLRVYGRSPRFCY